MSRPPLGVPPRVVPAAVRARLWFGGLGSAGWLWLCFALPLATLVARNTDATSTFRFEGALAARGTALGCEDTGAAQGGRRGGQRGTPVYRNRYRFAAGGVVHEGVSFATGACLPAGEAVIVEHMRGDPSVSRIRGQRRAVFPPVALLVLILPAAGLSMALVQLRRGRLWSDLLRSGSLASGRLVASRPTGLRVQRRPVLLLVYEFAGGGKRVQRFTVTTHRSLGTGSREIVLYDPRAPSRAVPWDLLAHFVELGPGGRFVVPGPLAVLWTLAPPAVACGLTAIVLAR